MIQFDTKVGKVRIAFHHNLPTIKIVAQNNRLASVKIKVLRGKTNCSMSINQDESVSEFSGTAVVHPHDQYNNEIGRRVSLERALQSAKLEFRLSDANIREIWSKYFAR
jgi:hypothetical protein